MPFAYFDRLSISAKRVYLASEAIREVALPNAEMLHPLLPILREALEKGRATRVGIFVVGSPFAPLRRASGRGDGSGREAR